MPSSSITKGGTRGTVYRELAHLRVEDAAALRKSARHNGAIYLAGYAVECQLKFAYCRRKGKINLPADLEVHDWDTLANAAGLLPDIRKQPAIEAIYSGVAEQWGPSLRYRTARYSEREANRLYNQIEQLYQFFRELVP